MRRWNGWGEEHVDYPLNDAALAFLRDRIGPGITTDDATLEAACAKLAPSRFAPHKLVDTSAPTRLRASFGQSLQDWLRLRFGETAQACDGVAFPESNEQVRELLDFARQCGAVVIPYGGGTSVAGHLVPPQGDRPVLTVSMARMNRLLHLDRTAQLATFAAGAMGPDLEAQLRAHGYTLGHFPQSFEYSTLGGWVVTRSSGQQSLRYGRIEQMFAGGRLETPRGTLIIPTFPASAAGIDLREMVLGSEGRLGVLTEATVRVTPLPALEAFHGVFFPSWKIAEQAVRQLVQLKLPLSMLRLSNEVETLTSLTMAGHVKMVGLLQRYLAFRGVNEGKCLLLLGVSGHPPTCRATLGTALGFLRRQHGVAIGRRLGEKWKANRFRSVYLRNTAWRHGYVIETVETACDWPKVETMMRRIEAAAIEALGRFDEKIHAYTHLSHLYPQGSSVYSTFVYRLAPSFEENIKRWRALKQAVSQTIVDNGGTITHQHGVGKDHAPYLRAEKGALGLDAMRALINELDPTGLMNSGNLGL
jgi:alkyldihydroxyacetonephosphate synthase